MRRYTSAIAAVLVLCIGLGGFPLPGVAVDTSGLDSTTRRHVEVAESAIYQGRFSAFHRAYEKALSRAGAIPQLAALERLYLDSLTDITDAVRAHADYLERWLDYPSDPEVGLDAVLQSAANLLLLTSGEDDIPLTAYRWFFEATESLLNDSSGTRVVESAARFKTLIACGRAAYAAQEFSWAVRCFEGARRALDDTVSSQDEFGIEVLRQRAARRGKPASIVENGTAYDLALASGLVDRARLLALYEIAMGDWDDERQSQAAREVLEGYPDSPEAVLMRASGEW